MSYILLYAGRVGCEVRAAKVHWSVQFVTKTSSRFPPSGLHSQVLPTLAVVSTSHSTAGLFPPGPDDIWHVWVGICVHNSDPTILAQRQLCFIVTGWKGWLRLAQEDHIILLYFSASSCFCPWKSHLIIGQCFCYRLWCFHLACKEILFVFGKFIFFSLFMWRLWQGQKLPEQMILVNYVWVDKLKKKKSEFWCLHIHL